MQMTVATAYCWISHFGHLLRTDSEYLHPLYQTQYGFMNFGFEHQIGAGVLP